MKAVLRSFTLALPVLVMACNSARPPEDAAAASDNVATPHEVTVIARNYAYQMPDTLASGLTRFHLINSGTEPHHLMFYRLDDGRTMSDAFAELRTGGPLPPWMHPAGGPNAPAPGSESWATVTLTPGHYMAFCHIPSRDHVLHLAKGMMKEVTVVPASDVRASIGSSDNGTPAVDVGAGVVAQLRAAGADVVDAELCTREDQTLFSHRRRDLGRLAGLVWVRP